MTLVAITGTPGTGKSTVADELRSRGYTVVDLKRHIIENGLMGDLDEERDTHEVDLDALNDSLEVYHGEGLTFMEGHLSHYMDCSTIIVLRCSPQVLARRLRERGYSERKVRENVQSEILDVILCEATDGEIPVFEIDSTGLDVAGTADAIEKIVKGEGDDYLPGGTDWSREMEAWF